MPISSSSAGTSIIVDDLGYDAPTRPILSNITIRSSARRIGVVGRNGSGKSTLVRLLAGLVRPSSGRLTINGINVHDDRRGCLQTVGILFQNPEHQIIFPRVTEEIAFGLRQQGLSKHAAKEAAVEVLERFGKAHWKDAPVDSLSQGQKHLLCMMAVLAMRPKLLILDEPFAGLDIPTRMQLNRFLDGCDISLLHVSHDPEDLRTYDEVYWLDEGRLKASGAAGPILAAFTEEMVRVGGQDDLSRLSD